LVLSPTRDFLAGMGATLPRPPAIVIASAHWKTEHPAANAVTENATIQDFHGFPLAP
jgi:4,5-DOPA dioxygenase extradiol